MCFALKTSMEKSTGEYNERKHKNIFLKKGESTGAACA
jgi:hypothetical protein